MRHLSKTLLSGSLLLCSSLSRADETSFNRSLVQDGPRASLYGELAAQQDRIENFNVIGTRVQGGWMLSRHTHASTTIGASYAGLLGKNENKTSEAVTYRYYGPIAEVIVFPHDRLKALLSYGYQIGSLKHSREADDLDYFLANLKIQEIRLSASWALGGYNQVIAGVSGQSIASNKVSKLLADGEYFRRRGESNKNSVSYFLGLRMAAF